jgi:hypothetical protein
MKINGLYFIKSDAKRMLDDIRSQLPATKRTKLMPTIKSAMEMSACKGLNGEPNATATLTAGGYQVTANVCCGGYAEVSVTKVNKVI